MKVKLNWDIAYTLLLARWKQTLVAAIGVTFSITMFITLLSFMTGLNGMLDSLILNRTPHIKLYNEIKPSKTQPVEDVKEFGDHWNIIHSIKPGAEKLAIYNVGAIISALKNDSRVKGIAPKVTSQVFYNVGTIEITGVINGIDVDAENELYYFSTYVTSGNYIDLKNTPNSIILGKAAGDKMLVEIGDMVQVTSAGGERMQLKVVGFFQSGLQDIDKVQSYTSLRTIQKLLGQNSTYITDLQVNLNNIDDAPALAKKYATLFDLSAEDIQTVNAQFETGTTVRNLISYSVGITLLIVAGFGIFNILNMMIYEKMDAIAILKATGFSGKDVKAIFMSISMGIGLFGAIFGLFSGYVLSSVIDQIPFNTAALPTIKTYPVNYNPVHYLTGCLFALLTTWLAGFFPAQKASRIDPVIIIRGK